MNKNLSYFFKFYAKRISVTFINVYHNQCEHIIDIFFCGYKTFSVCVFSTEIETENTETEGE